MWEAMQKAEFWLMVLAGAIIGYVLYPVERQEYGR